MLSLYINYSFFVVNTSSCIIYRNNTANCESNFAELRVPRLLTNCKCLTVYNLDNKKTCEKT